MIGGGGQGYNPLVAKLCHFAPLSDEEIGVLEGLCSNQERFSAGVNLAEEGEPGGWSHRRDHPRCSVTARLAEGVVLSHGDAPFLVASVPVGE